MKIETSKGKTFDIEFICSPFRDGSKVIIEMEDARPLAEIAADFDGLKSIKKTGSGRNDKAVYEMYEGFSQLVGIQRDTAAGSVRLTLAKGA